MEMATFGSRSGCSPRTTARIRSALVMVFSYHNRVDPGKRVRRSRNFIPGIVYIMFSPGHISAGRTTMDEQERYSAFDGFTHVATGDLRSVVERALEYLRNADACVSALMRLAHSCGRWRETCRTSKRPPGRSTHVTGVAWSRAAADYGKDAARKSRCGIGPYGVRFSPMHVVRNCCHTARQNR